MSIDCLPAATLAILLVGFQNDPSPARDGARVLFKDVYIAQDTMKRIVVQMPDKDAGVSRVSGQVPPAIVATRDLGRSVIAVPHGGEGTQQATRLVFALPKDGDGSLWFLAGEGEDVLRQSPGTQFGTYRGYGTSLGLMPDMDGDGGFDLIVGAPGSADDPGTVFVVSSGSREVLHALKSPGTSMLFGLKVCCVADMDGDGARDIAVLSAERSGDSTLASVFVLSTKTGKVISTPIRNQRTGSLRHAKMVWLPGEKYGSLLVALQSGTPRTLEAIGLADGVSSWSVRGEKSLEGIGWSLDLIQDLDHDGVLEVVVGDLRYGNQMDSARVRIVSGASGEILRSTNGLLAHPEAGMSVATYPDIDGDGVQEIVATQEGPVGGGGSLLFISGRTGEALKKYVLYGGFWQIGRTLGVGSDWDGKGLRDLCFSSSQRNVSYPEASAIGLLSLEDGAFIDYLNPEHLRSPLTSADSKR